MPPYHDRGRHVGRPDDNVGHGYGLTGTGILGRPRPSGRGFPYDHDVVRDCEQDDDDDLYDVGETLGITTVPFDPLSMRTADRRSYASAPMGFGESSLIRLRPASSEQDPGTPYGWSHPPINDIPRRVGGPSRPRYLDVIRSDEDDVVDDHEISDELTLREFIRHALHVEYLTHNFSRYHR
jgi:hypothetical protein